MRVAVVTCPAYLDAVRPFVQLFRKFWPACPYPVDVHVANASETWCASVARLAHATTEPLLLFQEDFFLNKPVEQSLVERGLELLKSQHAGCVRLYPCPGANFDLGDPHFGLVAFKTPFRISCQAAIWDPEYLYDIAVHSMWTTGEASDFENLGTPYSDTRIEPVLAFKREVMPWPLGYICSGISRGQWNPDSRRLFEMHGIEVDYSIRTFANA